MREAGLQVRASRRPAPRGPAARLYGMHLMGATLSHIASIARKSDGTPPSQQCVSERIGLCERRGGVKWDGDAGALARSGRPRETSEALDKAIVRLVHKHRGSVKVTVGFVKKHILKARGLSDSSVERRLGEAGLKWLRRRRKTLVLAEYKRSRVLFGEWVLTRTAPTLQRWIYSDGTATFVSDRRGGLRAHTRKDYNLRCPCAPSSHVGPVSTVPAAMVFYLARCVTEQLDKNRAALGAGVWKQADGSDALFEECVGPSACDRFPFISQ